MTNLFEVRNVFYSYFGKFPALAGVSLSIKRGEKVAIIGANGCGKSTLLHLLDGLIFPDKGEVIAFGEKLTESVFNNSQFSHQFRKRVGLVFQNSDIQLFCPTVKEDILFGPIQLGMDLSESYNRLEKLLDLLGIRNLLDRSPHQLSFGEKRKVALASILIINPEVLLLDEPTTGVDPKTTRNIIDLLLEENRLGKTIIITSQDLHIVEEVADTVYVFSQDKKIIRSGGAEEILKDTKMLQSNNLIHTHAHRHGEKTHVHMHLSLLHHPENFY